MNDTVNPKKVFELDEQFSRLRKKFFSENNLSFFKDYEQLLNEYDRYDLLDLTATVWPGGISQHIPKCDGLRTLASIGEILKPNKLSLADVRINQPGRATGETEVEIRKVVKDSTFGNLFFSFKRDLENLCFTQNQIVVFFEKYSHRLSCESRNAFLSKIGDKFVIFNVFLSNEEWIYHLLEFESYKKDNLYAIHKQFVVIPTYESSLK